MFAFPSYVECFAIIFQFDNKIILLKYDDQRSPDILKHNKMKCLPYRRARTKSLFKIRKTFTMFA